ncbi:MAG: PTS sugar transporter subunit IIB [Anaerococcus vaginalis]|uniref:PTS sugar transporter subunit IIB n=1 Tax=Anaerococcus TaxID=165779 RepID=UPI0008A2EC9A|nr:MULTISPECIES: PTS sugar transporter subunit IIB [Anaerococcus]MDU5086279.1 PTS sugar transporter subunit IIB [Anaerococcus vaginalis]OFL16126.1 PTS sorbose transporter subunit IIB [Anaerococcus sp. HMSC068A02]
MAKIKMARIDYRLIHGQVVAKCIKYNPVDRIILADDELVDDEFMADIYKMAAADKKVDIVSIKNLNKCLESSDDNVMLIFKNVDNCYKAVENGLILEEINVGASESTSERKQIIQGVSLSEKEIEKLDILGKKEIDVYSQSIPENSKISLENMKKKI